MPGNFFVRDFDFLTPRKSAKKSAMSMNKKNAIRGKVKSLKMRISDKTKTKKGVTTGAKKGRVVTYLVQLLGIMLSEF
jgi:hypothetical protein